MVTNGTARHATEDEKTRTITDDSVDADFAAAAGDGKPAVHRLVVRRWRTR